MSFIKIDPEVFGKPVTEITPLLLKGKEVEPLDGGCFYTLRHKKTGHFFHRATPMGFAWATVESCKRWKTVKTPRYYLGFATPPGTPLKWAGDFYADDVEVVRISHVVSAVMAPPKKKEKEKEKT